MNRYFYILLTFFCVSCEKLSSDKVQNKITLKNNDTTSILNYAVPSDSLMNEDTTNLENATYFVVIADTSSDYYLIQKKMFVLHKILNISIDTMGRFYNKDKNLIALPDNDEDEIYAGNYLPRRYPSENLSLEYLNFYQNNAGEKTIALVTGIYETENKADSILSVMQKSETKAFKVKAQIFIGCLH